MASTTTTTTTQMHVGLFVSELDRAVEFYRLLFGVEPAKHYADYVEFSLVDPPLVLVLSPQRHAPGGTLNHVGLRFRDATGLLAIEARLEQAGFPLKKQDQVACCYARGNKIWVTDPDHNLWEIYHLLEDLEHSGFENPEERPVLEPASPSLAVWEYRLPDPVPPALDSPDAALDEVRLCGLLNADVPPEAYDRLLAEAYRALKPGGSVVIQGLVAATEFPGKPDLPGLAAKIQRVPLETEPLDRLKRQGFEHIYYDELADIHCFQVDGVELRKLRISAQKPNVKSTDRFRVIYKGPLDQVRDETGHTFHRGELQYVDAAVLTAILQGAAASQFVILDPIGCCSGPAGGSLEQQARDSCCGR